MALDSNGETLDVAIVGAGVSGVYTGWRLLTDPPPGRPVPTVQVFEQSQRIGGRLLSVEPPGIPGVFCELGGMRYLSSQALVRSLVENKLKLETRPFVVEAPENLNYVRGQRFRNSDLANHANVPFELSWSERGATVDTVLASVLNQIVPGVTKMDAADLRDFLAEYEVDGRPLFDWGFWNLLSRGMSHEAYLLARLTGGYDAPMQNWNAFDTISLTFHLSRGITYSAIQGGAQSVPLRVAGLSEQAGGTINLGHRLEAFDVEPDGSIALRIRDESGVRIVRARSLVLAMPRCSLELIDPSGPVLDGDRRDVRALIESVTPIPLFKICVAYDFPWWESLGVSQGRSVTDLPIRQCYYWATAQAAGADPDNRKAVLLASYDDGPEHRLLDRAIRSGPALAVRADARSPHREASRRTGVGRLHADRRDGRRGRPPAARNPPRALHADAVRRRVYGLERRSVWRGRELLEGPRPQPGRDPAHDAARSAAAGLRLR